MPCCQSPSAYGEWYDPEGMPLMENSVELQSHRDNNGNINLFRVNNDFMSPTGRFCCVVEDATNISQTLCINIGELDVVPLQN